MEEANVSASLSVPKSVADSGIPEVQEVPASDATLSATRRIGGQRGYCTKLMQQVWLILNEKEFRRAREVVELKAQLEKSHEVYAASVEEFCKSLDQESPRYQEYMLQLNSRTVELADVQARVAEFMLEGIEERSATASNKSRGSVHSRKKTPFGCGGTVKSNSTMSSASKLRLEVKLAEMRLQQAESAARLQSQQMMLQAETALLEARIRAEVMEEQAFEEPADVQPEKALHDKVDDYLQSLPPSGPPPLECRSPAFLQMAHSTPDALAHDLPSHSEVNSSLSFPPPVISVSSPGDCNPAASNLNVQAESWQPQSSNAVGVETLASHGPAIADLDRPPVCRCEPSFFPGSALPRSSVPDGPSFLQGSALPRSSVPNGPSFLQGSALPRSSVPDGPSFLQGSALPRSSVPGPSFLQGSAFPRSSVPDGPSFLQGSALPRSSVPGPSFLQGSAIPRSSVPYGPSFLWGPALPRSSVPDAPSFLQGSALPRSSVPDGPSFLWGSALPRSSVPDAPSFLQGSALPRSSVPYGPSFLWGSALPRSSVPESSFLQGSALPRSSVPDRPSFLQGSAPFQGLRSFKVRRSLAAPFNLHLSSVLNFRLSLEITVSLVIFLFRVLLTFSRHQLPLPSWLIGHVDQLLAPLSCEDRNCIMD